MWRINALVVLAFSQLIGGCQGPAEAPPASLADSEHAGHEMAGPPQTLADWARGAMLFDGLGDFHRTITTASPEAQRYFDQGMRFLWAFNHDESTRSFARAAELDPSCASCFWGVALTVGPNYNLPFMAEPRARVAWDALQRAQSLAGGASPVEQALIGALASRYRGPDPLDPSNEGPQLAAYATAMGAVAQRFPDDLDVQTLYAEALMNVNAWKLWTPEGQAAPGTDEIVATLESVLRRDPNHPGANHYYIHAIEASPHPERAVAAAERVKDMMPAAGHLVHMPAHIMQRIGRYEDATEANRRGAAADARYLQETQPLDYYAMYFAHNYQFLAYSAAMEGRSAETLDAVERMRTLIPDEMLLAMPGFDWYLTELYSAMIRFGRWDQLLAEPAPNSELKGLSAGYLYGRTVALAATGRLEEAEAALTGLRMVAEATPEDYGAGLNQAKDVFAIAILVAKARLDAARGDTDDSIAALSEAVADEDRLAYDEPSNWFFPVRHLLGAELLGAGRAAEAEAVYREDLLRNPRNGWSLYGLAQALRAEGRDDEATAVEREFAAAWQRADITITASAF